MSNPIRRILVTGANGFIGKNFIVRMSELTNIEIKEFVRGDSLESLSNLLTQVDAVVHLAGENRPTEESAFLKVNMGLTQAICDALYAEWNYSGRQLPLIFLSSTQSLLDNPYGQSKLAAERAVEALSKNKLHPTIIYRLPGVFGKWCKPNYNSVIATFCHNIARDLPIQIHNSQHVLTLVFVDDVVNALINSLESTAVGCTFASVNPEYSITIGELALRIKAFAQSRSTLMCEHVGVGLTKALYSTYVSYLPSNKFSYEVPKYIDSRGVFVELLKTQEFGQFSYFTAHPGIIRGGHYHHTKTEKFLVLKGEALFRFRHLITSELVEFRTNGSKPIVVDTIPGWTHDITNVGSEEMIVMLWANEIFDQTNPDTVIRKIH